MLRYVIYCTTLALFGASAFVVVAVSLSAHDFDFHETLDVGKLHSIVFVCLCVFLCLCLCVCVCLVCVSVCVFLSMIIELELVLFSSLTACLGDDDAVQYSHIQHSAIF